MSNQSAPRSKEKDAVLIVDDDAFMLKVLYRVLQNDYTLYQAGSAEEAVEVLRGRNVKAILCDHVLPGQTGLDFLIALRQRNARIKSVLFSAALETEQFIKAINHGQVFRFIKKPASPTDILSAVREAIRQYDIEDLQQQIQIDQKDIDKQLYSTAAPYWLYRLRVIAQQSFRYGAPLFGNVLALLLALGVIALSVGICIMLILYFVKSYLGIDILHNSHLFN
ncbi:response regulator [Tichowtungia aerotolerans]|uniref:Response regulator n=1 Tax=Tichowtungia aerotolerans TaxID=2697043 RepID=A0A6P1M7S7_9BACT|nr:response regulator [Tichowtungia aerotolerans]QHI68228.1 response regulator [Tichowtungia aerotolerans]